MADNSNCDESTLQEEILDITETLNEAIYDVNRYKYSGEEYRKKSAIGRLKESRRLINQILEQEVDTESDQS